MMNHISYKLIKLTNGLWVQLNDTVQVELRKIPGDEVAQVARMVRLKMAIKHGMRMMYEHKDDKH